MKTPPDNPEFARFTAAMKTIMKVPKTAIQPTSDSAKTRPQVGRKMNPRVGDFAQHYSKMSDDELARIAEDRKNLVPEAAGALDFEIASRPQAAHAVEEPKNPLYGVRGWLAFYCFCSIVGSLCYLISGIVDILSAPTPGPYVWLLLAVPLFPLIVGIALCAEASFALGLLFIQFILAGIPLAGSIVVLIVERIGHRSLSPETTRQGIELLRTVLPAIALWAIWFTYFKVSKRVCATFGRNI